MRDETMRWSTGRAPAAFKLLQTAVHCSLVNAHVPSVYYVCPKDKVGMKLVSMAREIVTAMKKRVKRMGKKKS